MVFITFPLDFCIGFPRKMLLGRGHEFFRIMIRCRAPRSIHDSPGMSVWQEIYLPILFITEPSKIEALLNRLAQVEEELAEATAIG
jgi:hypothetical protein